MAEKPILFSGEMVRAILARRKTQTRRVVKFPKHVPDFVIHDIASVNPDGRGDWVAWSPRPVTDEQSKKMYPNGGGFICPYGRPGDLLWVREAWQAQNTKGQWYHQVPYAERPLHFWAWTNPINPAFDATPPRWLPSIHMPRWASRITLRVTDVRVERVQDISEADALAEGCKAWKGVPGDGERTARQSFVKLWNEINGPRGFGWDANPWVWVVEFSPLDQIGHSMA